MLTLKHGWIAEHPLSEEQPCLPLMAACAASQQVSGDVQREEAGWWAARHWFVLCRQAVTGDMHVYCSGELLSFA